MYLNVLVCFLVGVAGGLMFCGAAAAGWCLAAGVADLIKESKRWRGSN